MNFKSLFKRGNRAYPAVDGIRAIAVIWVILFHAWLFQSYEIPDPTEWGPDLVAPATDLSKEIYRLPVLTWITKGDLAVDLFFVISGFLIGGQLFKQRKETGGIDFKRFYLRRIRRLMPAYLIAMLLALYFMNGINVERAWSNLLYINNYVRDSYIGWTWSLAIEEQFYMVVPVLVAFLFPFFKKKRWPFGLLFLAPILMKWIQLTGSEGYQLPFNVPFFTPEWDDWFWGYYMHTHLRYNGLLLGVAAAYLHLHRPELMVRFFSSRVRSNLLFTFSILMIIGIASIPTGQWVFLKDSVFHSLPPEAGWVYECLHRELFCVATAAIILASIYAEGWIDPIKRFLGHRWFYPVAQVSYSAYLLHEMFMFWLFPRINSAFGSQLSEVSLAILNGFIVLVMTLAGAAVMFLWIEEPFLRRRAAESKGLTK
jgi:peptidoglycan/LPS O-acetylase OafA/YrhL